MNKVRVDFNTRGQGGTVRGHMRHASGPLHVGERVTLVDALEEDMSFEATVVSLDAASGVTYFEVEWEAANGSWLLASVSRNIGGEHARMAPDWAAHPNAYAVAL